MDYGGTPRGCAIAAAMAAVMAAAPAQAQSALVGGLADVNFGTVPAMVEQSNSQNIVVCSYRGQPNARPYSVIASGSGPGSAFELSTGAASLPYDVQWADSPGQTGGTMLQAGAAASGFGNGATGFECDGRPDTASLTVTIRAADLASAQAGSYAGTLQITIVPE
jgi:hypothetical protein